MAKTKQTTAPPPPAKAEHLPAIAPPRLPYHPGLQERFGIDQTSWRALVESTFPGAKSVNSVILALAYCKSRNLDPFKKVVHIVPIWDKERKCMVDTVWPGIAEYRTTAFRTGEYAGHDEIQHGPIVEKTWDDEGREIALRFPEWAQLTVYRMVAGVRCQFPGPRVYWLETYASKKNDAPNQMWSERPIGMLDKCAEAAALRGAFPEELGGEITAEEVRGFQWHGRPAVVQEQPKSRTEMLLEATASDPAPDTTPEPPTHQDASGEATEATPPAREPGMDDDPDAPWNRPADLFDAKQQ